MHLRRIPGIRLGRIVPTGRYCFEVAIFEYALFGSWFDVFFRSVVPFLEHNQEETPVLNKLSISASALAVVAFAGAASAQNITYLDAVDNDGGATGADVVIEVVVEEIAELEVTNETATMTIDDSSGSFMGNPSSSLNDFTNVATLELRSNFDVDAVDFFYPTQNNIAFFGGGGNPGRAGAATCVGTCNGSTVIGVQPQASPTVLTGQSVYFGDNTFDPGNNEGRLRVSGTNRTTDNSGGLPAGATEIGIGVSTEWDRTLSGEPEFAGAGTYSITFTAVVVPTI